LDITQTVVFPSPPRRPISTTSPPITTIAQTTAPTSQDGSKILNEREQAKRNSRLTSCSTRRTYANVVGSTTKRGYRADLHKHAIARTSAIKKSQAAKKDAPKPKLRGAKAKKAAEAS
jgi:hypothetical protein